MNLAKLRLLSLYLAAAAVLGLGLGPTFSSGLVDLGVAQDTAYLGVATSAILFLTGFAMSVLASVLWRNVPGRQFRIVFATSAGIGLALAALAMWVNSIDGMNSTAWRNAIWLDPSDGIETRRMDEYGNHFGRLVVTADYAEGGRIAEVPVPFRVLVTGGEYRMLSRLNPPGGRRDEGICATEATLVLQADGTDETRTIRSIPVSELCGRWESIDFAVPAGTRLLTISAPASNIAPPLSVDLMIVDVRPNFSGLWAMATFLGAGVFLGLLFRLAQLPGREIRREPAGDRSGKLAQPVTLALALLVFLCAGNAFVYWFVSQEQTIYTWDNAGYWKSAIGVSQFLKGAERKSVVQQEKDRSRQIEGSGSAGRAEPELPRPGAIAALVRNIRYTEYNVTTSLPVAPLMAALGESRTVYELALLNVYAMAAVVFLVLAVRVCGYGIAPPWPSWWPFVPVVAVLCFVPFWVPIVRGYMGISIVAPNLAILWLYFLRPPDRARIGTLLAIGLLLVAGVLLQRWNAYWVISFFVMAAADSVYFLWRMRRFSVAGLMQAFRVPAFAGLIALCSFLVLAWPKVVTIVTTNYADIYSAYLEHTGLLSAFLRIVGDTGLLLSLFVIASFAHLISIRSTRRVAALLAIQVVFVFVHMSGTQTMGPHHLYVLMPASIIALCLAFIQLASRNEDRAKIAAVALACLYVATGVASMVSVFTRSSDELANTTGIRLLSNDYRPPLVRGDLAEFDRLALFLDQQLQGAPDSVGVYVLAGSQVLNPEHLENLGPSLGRKYLVQDRLVRASIVDKRDGFPREILSAELVVTSDPVQLSRRPEDHYVIRIPARHLMNGTGIGSAFERLPPVFRLDSEVEVSVFRRIRHNTSEEIAALSEEFRALYPDRPDLYE